MGLILSFLIFNVLYNSQLTSWFSDLPFGFNFSIPKTTGCRYFNQKKELLTLVWLSVTPSCSKK